MSSTPRLGENLNNGAGGLIPSHYSCPPIEDTNFEDRVIHFRGKWFSSCCLFLLFGLGLVPLLCLIWEQWLNISSLFVPPLPFGPRRYIIKSCLSQHLAGRQHMPIRDRKLAKSGLPQCHKKMICLQRESRDGNHWFSRDFNHS